MSEREKRFHRSVDEKMVRENPDPMTPASLETARTPKWEYKSALLPREADISAHGAEGWECYSVTAQPGDLAMFYFRRRRP